MIKLLNRCIKDYLYFISKNSIDTEANEIIIEEGIKNIYNYYIFTK